MTRLARSARRQALVAFAIALATLLLSIGRAHSGDWAGPFLVGSRCADTLAPAVGGAGGARESQGYDGQFYLALALDPLVTGDDHRCLDLPRYRARRMLWPWLGIVFAAGIPAAVPYGLALAQILGMTAGAAAVGAWAVAHERSEWWGSLFVLGVGNLICVWRELGDSIAVALLLLGLVLLERGRSRLAMFALGAALLGRETLFVVWVALVLATLVRSRGRELMPLLLAAVPALAWYLYVDFALPPDTASVVAINFGLPAEGLIRSTSADLSQMKPLLHKLKDVAFVGTYLFALMGGLWLGGSGLLRSSGNKWSRLAVDLALLALAVQGFCLSAAAWTEVWAYGRILLPLVALLLIRGLERAIEPRDERQLWFWGRLPVLCAALGGALFILSCAIRGTA